MQKQNRAALVLFGVNLVVLILLGCVNSVVGQYGVFLYLPALFFLPGALCLDNSRGIPPAFVTGLLLDQQIETSRFSCSCLVDLSLVELELAPRSQLPKGFFYPGPPNLPANLLFFVLWLLWVAIFENATMEWTLVRWFTDLAASTVALIPLAVWMSGFAESLLGMTRLFPEGSEESG